MLRIKYVPRTLLLTIGCVGILLGLAAIRVNRWPLDVFSCIVLLAAALLLAWRVRKVTLLFALIGGFMLGYARGHSFLERTKPLAELNNRTIIATVKATGDAVYGDHSQLGFDADHLELTEPYKATLPGSLQIAGFGEMSIYKGDLVEVEGKVKLIRGSKQLRMSFADLRVVERNHSLIDHIRRRFTAGMQSALPEPHASFAMGLLIGQKSTLPEDIMFMLSAVGLTHIIAVSGYNLTIIADASRKVLRRGSKYQITLCSTILILLFIIMTGLSASIVRAAIVSLLSLAAWYFGRRFKPLLLISLTAALTATWNPFYLWSDIGWYLSFLAFFGVMVMGPLLNQKLFKTDNLLSVKALFTESVCAMVMTIPFIMYIFKQVSIIALVANLLVVPFVPLAMLLALFAGIAGMLLPSAGGWIAWPARVMLTYMLDIIGGLSRIPHVLLQRQLSILGMLSAYGLICLFLIILWSKYQKNATITEIKRSLSGERT